MKKTVFFSIAMALMAIVGCNKNQPSNVDELSYEGPTGKLKVTVALADGETKANQTSGVEGHANEKKIESLQVFVFNKATGRLEAERYETYATPGDGTKTMTLTTLTGEKEVWAITNAPRQTGISSAPTNTEARNQLKAKMSYLENNKVNALQMVGSADVTVAETEANLDAMKDVATSVNIPVKRLAARVTLDKVTVDYTGTQLEGATLQITGMYLKNVVRMCRMDGDSSGAGMVFNVVGSYVNAYNYAAVNSGSDAIKALTSDGIASALAIPAPASATDNKEINIGYSWYCYPNTTVKAEDHTDAATYPRCTRLVLRCHLGGTASEGAVNRDTYYVLTIPFAIQANKIYKITNAKITIEGKPNDDTDEPTTSGKLNATVTVQNWDGTTELTYNI